MKKNIIFVSVILLFGMLSLWGKAGSSFLGGSDFLIAKNPARESLFKGQKIFITYAYDFFSAGFDGIHPSLGYSFGQNAISLTALSSVLVFSDFYNILFDFNLAYTLNFLTFGVGSGLILKIG